MIEIDKRDLNIHKIPEKSGFFVFLGKEGVLYFSKSTNLQKTIQTLLEKDMNNKEVLKLNSLTNRIKFETTENMIRALSLEKCYAQNHRKEIEPHFERNYTYLALDFKVPYLQVTEDTQKDHFYLGPFRDRFFLYDLLVAMQNAFGFPNCENEKYPCKHYTEKDCSGWCLKEQQETIKMLIDNYILCNPQLIEQLNIQHKKFFAELQFEKAESVKALLRSIKKYQNYLKFLTVTKKLTLKNNEYKIENGLLTGKEQHGFFNRSIEYRKNEILAFDKSELAERWILFQYCSQKDKELVTKLHKDSIQDIQDILSGVK